MKKAIIFDMDGVLFDTEMIYIQKRIKFFAEFDPFVCEEAIRKSSGSNGVTFIRTIYKDRPKEEVEAIVEQYRSIQDPPENFVESMFPGVVSTLQELYDSGCVLALASSSSQAKIDMALDVVDIRKYFTSVLSATKFHAIKPDPTVYLESLKKLGLSSEEVLVVEDSTFGIQAAKRAGLDVICRRDDRFGYDQSGCEYYIDSIPEILDIWRKVYVSKNA